MTDELLRDGIAAVHQLIHEAAENPERRAAVCGSGIIELVPADFPEAIVLAQIAAMHNAGEPAEGTALDVRLLGLPENLKERALTAFHEAETHPPTDNLAWYLDQARRSFLKVSASKEHLRLAEVAANGSDPSELIDGTRALLHRLESATGSAEELEFVDFTAPLPQAAPPLVGRSGCTLIPSGEKTGAVADSGAGKTHLLVPLGLGIAAGCKVMDFDCKQGPVLFVSSDDDPDLVRKFQRHAAGLKLDLGTLPLRVLNDPAFNIDEPGAVARIRKALSDLGADKQPGTFILESLTTNVVPQQTDLYDGVSVRAYIRRTVAALQADFPGLTPILSHHLKKSQAGGANDLSTRVSGSVQIRAGMDLVIGLVKNGEERFTVRTVKRSRSGARFDAFRVRIVGDPDAPLTLQDEGPVEASPEELQGAAGAVLAFLKAAGGPRLLKAIVGGVTGFRTRTVQEACQKLASQDDPPLIRVGIKPASYTLAPPKQTPLDLGGLD